MTDKSETNPDVPVEKSPFALPDTNIQPPSPFASQSDTQVLTKQADAKANEFQLPSPTRTLEENQRIIAAMKLPMPVEVKPPVTADLVLKMLIDLPDDIYDYQKIYDSVLIQYETRLSDLSYKALSSPMFPGKKDEPLRAASNDKEREIATSQVIAADERMKLLTQELNESRGELALAKNKFLAAQLAANLLAVQ